MYRRLVVALLVLLAGCSGFAGGNADEARTVNPALRGTVSPTPTPTPVPDYPPGVSAAGVDAWVLSNAHDRAVEDAGATVRTNRTITGPNGTTLATVRSEAALDGERVASGFVTGGAAPERVGVPGFDFALWSDGTETAVRRTRTDGSVEYTRFPGQPSEALVSPGTGQSAVYRVLADVDAEVAGTAVVDGERRFVLRAEHDVVERIGGPTLLNYSLVASVDERGVVRSYRVRYEERREGVGLVTIDETLRVARLGNTTVERPAWVEDPRRADDGGGRGDG